MRRGHRRAHAAGHWAEVPPEQRTKMSDSLMKSMKRMTVTVRAPLGAAGAGGPTAQAPPPPRSHAPPPHAVPAPRPQIQQKIGTVDKTVISVARHPKRHLYPWLTTGRTLLCRGRGPGRLCHTQIDKQFEEEARRFKSYV